MVMFVKAKCLNPYSLEVLLTIREKNNCIMDKITMHIVYPPRQKYRRMYPKLL